MMPSSLEAVREREAVTERSTSTSLMAPLFAAVQFLTIIPPVVRRAFTPVELGWSVAFFSVAGVLVGAILIGVDRAAGLIFPPGVAAALLLVAWVLVTGALHLDGFLDTCDGLFGGRTPEDRLRIMRDERVGAYAVAGGILLMLVKFNALTALATRETGLLLAPVLGRWAMVLAVIGFPYARPHGLGRDMKDHAGWVAGLFATLITAALCFLGAAWTGLLAFGMVLLMVGAGGVFVLRRLPGLTGDTYGCFCELAEAVVLLTLVAGDQT
jgi:adenosylcobinamide-GDP ribazoletransferase